MRTVLSALSVLLAVVLTAAAVPSLWIERNVVDEEGFVRLLEPLGNDAEFQTSLGTSLADTAVSASGIPQPLQPAAGRLTETIVQGLTSDPAFPAAWTETLRESHRLNLSPSAASAPAFTLELRPLADVLLNRLGSQLGVSLGKSPSLTVPVGTAQQRAVLTAAQDAAALSGPLTAGAVLAFVLGLLVARRRGVALGWSGLGLLLVAAVLGAGASLAASLSAGQGTPGTVASLFAARGGRLLADGFMPWVIAVALLGAVCLVVSLVLGARRRRAAGRR